MEGEISLADTKKLRKKITSSGMSFTYVSSKLGITREGFYKKMANETEFKASEIAMLRKVLGLTVKERDDIFFN